VQIHDDGTHVILRVATPFAGRLDHAAVPVMWLRQTDGKMRRDGYRLPCRSESIPVDERGNLHGAPGLSPPTTLRGVDAKVLSQQREEATMGEMKVSVRRLHMTSHIAEHWRSRTGRVLTMRRPDELLFYVLSAM